MVPAICNCEWYNIALGDRNRTSYCNPSVRNTSGCDTVQLNNVITTSRHFISY
jgi:hypothetical protein